MDLHSDPDLLKLITRNQPIVRTSAPTCPKCNKNVYKAEETRAASQTFHKLCFKCTSCSRPLESNILTEHQGDLFCKSCYAKNFGPRGYGYGSNTLSMDNNSFNSLTNGGANGSLNSSNENGTVDSNGNYLSIISSNNNSLTSSTSSTASSASLPYRTDRKSSVSTSAIIPGATEKCGRCEKAVYMAEKVMAAGRAYHKLCFTCFNCKKMLNSMICCDNSDNEIFCKACYAKQYGPKGIGYGIGAGTLKTN